jgi:hypothetical protein
LYNSTDRQRLKETVKILFSLAKIKIGRVATIKLQKGLAGNGMEAVA